jgi:TorA maturation chaperone TorD
MTEAEIETAVAREDVCRYLAACYYEPEPAFEEEGMFSALVEAAGLVDPALLPMAQNLRAAFCSARPEELLLDYTRLFLGPMKILAQPYGSVWLTDDKTLMGETSMAVLALYQEGGFEMDEEFRELPDHIAVELEFLYLLLFRENEASLQGDIDKLNTVGALKTRFLTEHLGLWISPFTKALESSAESDFYRQLARLTKSFLDLELEANRH